MWYIFDGLSLFLFYNLKQLWVSNFWNIEISQVAENYLSYGYNHFLKNIWKVFVKCFNQTFVQYRGKHWVISVTYNSPTLMADRNLHKQTSQGVINHPLHGALISPRCLGCPSHGADFKKKLNWMKKVMFGAMIFVFGDGKLTVHCIYMPDFLVINTS